MTKGASLSTFGPAVLPPPGAADDAVQRVVNVRRDYNRWVASETLEDYALRFTPRRFRRWSLWRVANTALGGAASFLVLEAVGATLLVGYGFANALWAILATGLVIFLAGIPISRYAAEHGVDMDLLTRGAGFGYLGSTITSLIYASFTFIFFALEAAIMAYALDLAFDIPPAWGYLVCALVVVPLVTHGVTWISRLQVWTQPLWLVLLVLPYVVVLHRNPDLLGQLVRFGRPGVAGGGAGFDIAGFGAATTVGIALITQMGEQADYLRFMPERTPENRRRWWAAVLIGGPGWVVPGVLKMLGGALLACLAIGRAVPPEHAVDPNQMYLAAYENVFSRESWAIGATALLVIVSQLKINVTNGYAGSLAWSNFFARLTHSHPGRVVWVVFNIAIALMLMELDVFQALGTVLGLYANIAISWIMAVVADLVVNKPLGLSPPGIEFKRAHLYDINPVGVGAMGLASVVSIAAYLGLLGAMAQAFSAAIAMVTAFVAAPAIAWWTRGRYALARAPGPVPATPQAASTCIVCERSYEADDMADCPAYLGRICSLCCSLDARCDDMCKPGASWSAQWQAAARWLLPRALWRRLDGELGRYCLLMAVLLPALAALFYAIYRQAVGQLVVPLPEAVSLWSSAFGLGFVKAFAALAVLTAIVTWWLVLTHKSRQVAQEESNRQTQALNQQTQALRREIASHARTDAALQRARDVADAAKRAADLANQAKSRYISSVSHELRTPLNSIIGYAQLLDDDPTIPAHRRHAVRVIRRGGDHLLSLIEGTLDLARIEGGKLSLDSRPMRFADCVAQIAHLFDLQAAAKGIAFRYEPDGTLPSVVRCDEKRLRQVLINVLANAVKFTAAGEVVFRVRHARELAVFEVADTGPGISADEIDRVFEPFARGSAGSTAAGSGLGLTIAKMLTDVMGGEMTVQSTPGAGSVFRMRLFLPVVHAAAVAGEVPAGGAPIGYVGKRRTVLVVDNEEVDRELLANVLEPLGFTVRLEASGDDCIAALRRGAEPPDAILMDLAMPGSDGWETIRTIQREGLTTAPIAIVTANAFDQGLDNDVGIAPSDFVLKPVRKAELLSWLQRALALEWIDAPVARGDGTHLPRAVLVANDAPVDSRRDQAPTGVVRESPLGTSSAVIASSTSLGAATLAALVDAVERGHPRGIARLLDEIDAGDPAAARFTGRMRACAERYDDAGMQALLREVQAA